MKFIFYLPTTQSDLDSCLHEKQDVAPYWLYLHLLALSPQTEQLSDRIFESSMLLDDDLTFNYVMPLMLILGVALLQGVLVLPSPHKGHEK